MRFNFPIESESSHSKRYKELTTVKATHRIRTKPFKYYKIVNYYNSKASKIINPLAHQRKYLSLTISLSLSFLLVMNCFCGKVDWQRGFSLISSRDHFQRFLPSQIVETLSPRLALILSHLSISPNHSYSLYLILNLSLLSSLSPSRSIYCVY